MKEFVEKLIGRLEEKEKCYHERALDEIMNNGHTMDAEGFLEKEDTYGDATSIVKELAEEYQSRVMIDNQYCWQKCCATEMCSKCNRLCNGSIDYFEPLDCYEYEDKGE